MIKMSYNILGKPKIIVLLGCIVVLMIAMLIETVFDSPPYFSAPFIEETLKVSVLIYLVVKYPYILKTKRDAIIFGGLVGLIFGLIESFLIIAGGEYPLLTTLIMRPFAMIMHVFSSGVATYGVVSLANQKFDRYNLNISILFKNIKSSNILSFLIIAIFIHLQYNTLIDFGLIGFIIGVSIYSFIYYKIYCYVPDNIDIPINGPFKLLSEALHTKKRKSINDIILEIIRIDNGKTYG